MTLYAAQFILMAGFMITNHNVLLWKIHVSIFGNQTKTFVSAGDQPLNHITKHSEARALMVIYEQACGLNPHSEETV